MTDNIINHKTGEEKHFLCLFGIQKFFQSKVQNSEAVREWEMRNIERFDLIKIKIKFD